MEEKSSVVTVNHFQDAKAALASTIAQLSDTDPNRERLIADYRKLESLRPCVVYASSRSSDSKPDQPKAVDDIAEITLYDFCYIGRAEFDQSPVERILNHIKEAFCGGCHSLDEYYPGGSSLPFRLSVVYLPGKTRDKHVICTGKDESKQLTIIPQMVIKFHISYAESGYPSFLRVIPSRDLPKMSSGSGCHHLNRRLREKYQGETVHNGMRVAVPMTGKEIQLAMTFFLDYCVQAIETYFDTFRSQATAD